MGKWSQERGECGELCPCNSGEAERHGRGCTGTWPRHKPEAVVQGCQYSMQEFAALTHIYKYMKKKTGMAVEW